MQSGGVASFHNFFSFPKCVDSCDYRTTDKTCPIISKAFLRNLETYFNRLIRYNVIFGGIFHERVRLLRREIR